jgi:hypothetical protein
MNRVTNISAEELAPVQEARNKVIELSKIAEKAVLEARASELEYKVLTQQLYLVKGLNIECKIDITSGDVTWPGDEPVAEVLPTEIQGS